MNILITGGAGFIGSHLCEALIALGHAVTILDDFSTGRNENIQHLEGRGLGVAYGDVREKMIVFDLVSQVDQVYHLASAVGVQKIIDEPIRTIETIVEGTAVVLSACARYRKPVLITSTSEVYGKTKEMPLSEDGDIVIGGPHRRRWSYAASKALDEFLALAHWHHSGLPVVIARLFNTVGPRQTGRYGMVVPRLVQQALRGEVLTVYGDGEQTRCFCHVLDSVRALIGLMNSHQATRGQVVNVGNNQEVSIFDLACTIAKAVGRDPGIELIPYEKAYGSGFEDMPRRVPDISLIKSMIGWEPLHDLDAIIRDVIQFERAGMPSDSVLDGEPASPDDSAIKL